MWHRYQRALIFYITDELYRGTFLFAGHSGIMQIFTAYKPYQHDIVIRLSLTL